MIVYLEDILMFLVAIAPIVMLFVWLMDPKSKTRIGLLVASLFLFFVFLPSATLFLGVVLLELFTSWPADSSIAYGAARVILMFVPPLCLLLMGMLFYRSLGKKKGKK